MRNHIMGHIYFIAPEKLEFKPELGRESDIYSFGVTLYHAVTGTPHVYGRKPEDTPELCTFLQRRDILPLDTANKTYNQLTLACLERKPQNRPTAKEVHAILKTIG